MRKPFIKFYNLYMYLTNILVDFIRGGLRMARIRLNLKKLILDLFNRIIQKYDYYLSGVTDKILKGHTDNVKSVAVLDEDRIVSGSWDKTLRIWDTKGETEQILKGHTEAVTCFAVLSDGRIVSGSRDKTLRIWETE